VSSPFKLVKRPSLPATHFLLPEGLDEVSPDNSPTIVSRRLQSTAKIVEEAEEQDEMLKPMPAQLQEQVEVWGSFSPADASALLLRGPTYLLDNVKVQNANPSFQLASFVIFTGKSCISHIAAEPDSYIALHRRPGDFFFVVNFTINNINVVMYLLQKPDTGSKTEGHGLCLETLLNGTDAERNSRFKLIPYASTAPYVVKRAVGTKPAIIGKKLTTVWHSEAGKYIEADIDVNSSKVGASIFKIVKGYAKKLVLDLSFTIEAQTNTELVGGERLLGGVRVCNVDLDNLETREQRKHI